MFDGKLLSVNVYHRTLEVLRADGVTSVVTVPSAIAYRVAGAAKNAAQVQSSLTVRVHDETGSLDKQGERVADPVIVGSLARGWIYGAIDVGGGATDWSIRIARKVLERNGFRLRQSRRNKLRIVVSDDTIKSCVATKVTCQRRRLPNEIGRMPLSDSTGQSCASWTDRSNAPI